jgi:hypothetical protein
LIITSYHTYSSLVLINVEIRKIVQFCCISFMKLSWCTYVWVLHWRVSHLKIEIYNKSRNSFTWWISLLIQALPFWFVLITLVLSFRCWLLEKGYPQRILIEGRFWPMNFLSEVSSSGAVEDFDSGMMVWWCIEV